MVDVEALYARMHARAADLDTTPTGLPADERRAYATQWHIASIEQWQAGRLAPALYALSLALMLQSHRDLT